MAYRLRILPQLHRRGPEQVALSEGKCYYFDVPVRFAGDFQVRVLPMLYEFIRQSIKGLQVDDGIVYYSDELDNIDVVSGLNQIKIWLELS